MNNTHTTEDYYALQRRIGELEAERDKWLIRSVDSKCLQESSDDAVSALRREIMWLSLG